MKTCAQCVYKWLMPHAVGGLTPVCGLTNLLIPHSGRSVKEQEEYEVRYWRIAEWCPRDDVSKSERVVHHKHQETVTYTVPPSVHKHAFRLHERLHSEDSGATEVGGAGLMPARDDSIEQRRAYTDQALEEWAHEVFDPRSQSPMAVVTEMGLSQVSRGTPPRSTSARYHRTRGLIVGKRNPADGVATRSRKQARIPLEVMSVSAQRVQRALNAVGRTNPLAHTCIREWAMAKVDGRSQEQAAASLGLKVQDYYRLRRTGHDLVMHELHR